MHAVRFPQINERPLLSHKSGRIDFIKPMEQDDQNSIELDNDFSYISRYEPTMENNPKTLIVEGAKPHSSKNEFRNEPIEKPFEKSPIPIKIITKAVEHVQIQPAVERVQILIDSKRILQFSFLFIFFEYLIILGLQFVSWFAIKDFIKSTTYITGVVLLLVYLILAILMIFLTEKINPIILKICEFLVYLCLVSWALAFLDFSFFSLSYMIMFTFLLFWIFVW